MDYKMNKSIAHFEDKGTVGRVGFVCILHNSEVIYCTVVSTKST